MFCAICGSWLGNGGLSVADALWNAGLGVENKDFVDRVCGNVDAMFNGCTRAVVENTLAVRRGLLQPTYDELVAA